MENRNLLIYLLNFVTNALINFDHGIIPACTTDMKLDLGIDDIGLGLMGSSVYGGLAQAYLTNIKLNIQLQSVYYVAYQVYLYLFQPKIYFSFLYRDFQQDSFKYAILIYLVFLVVFFPVWIDLFGENHKTMWLTYMQLGVALGTVSGYLVTSLSLHFSQNWVYPYYLQIILLIPCFLFYSFCDETMLSTKEQDKIEIKKENFKTIFLQNLKTFLSNPVFVFSMLSLSSLFFVVTGVQFWITDYLRNVLLMPHEVVFKSFLIISLSAPLTGVYLGGLILHNFGGYDGQMAIKIAAFEALLASISGAFIPILNNGTFVLLFLWFLLFFGGSAVPAIMGIMITSIPKEQRSSGNSLSHLFQELLGYLPAPVLYGYVQQQTGGSTSRWGMILLSIVGFFGLFYIVLAIFWKQKQTLQLVSSVNESELRDRVPQLNSIDKNDIIKKSEFAQIRMQTSVQSGKSIMIPVQQDQINNEIQNENQTSLIHRTHTFKTRDAYQRQASVSQALTNFSILLGRGSLDNDLFSIKNNQKQMQNQQKEIELQVAGGFYLVSEGRYVKFEEH
ncbi:unnamed protein product [Paramecium pentaurelia]|uniref:Major facilitator superfamily (MFS) profile domain-containing protein n=1 Tax=Paramecium pentaurelia TaxID=43138 RepID=A0A8S1SFA2_9CILI|nr:unnamed protein product [Paramecium pentaurelia]